MGHPWLESRYIYNTSLLIIINNCFIIFKIYILVKLCQSSLSVILFWLWFLICNYLWYLHIHVCPVSWFLLNKIKIKSNQKIPLFQYRCLYVLNFHSDLLISVGYSCLTATLSQYVTYSSKKNIYTYIISVLPNCYSIINFDCNIISSLKNY